MFVVCAIVAWILRDHGYNGLKRVGAMEDCADEDCTGRGIVLRITFSMAVLSSILMCMVIGVSNSKEPRAKFQNDFWFLKWLALAGITVGSLYMSNDDVMNYAYVAAVASGLFLCLGIILVMEFAYAWNDSWVESYTQTDDVNWGRLIVFTAMVFYGISISVWVLMFQHYGGEGCNYANGFLIVTVILSTIITFTSILEVVENGALMVSGLMVLYCTYLCSSAIIGLPVDDLNTCTARHSSTNDASDTAIYSLGVLFTIATVAWATIRSASQGQKFGMLDKNARTEIKSESGGDEEDGVVEQDEESDVEYNYAFFHFVYALGAMYVGMVMINWNMALVEKDGSSHSVSTWANVWVKIASQWICFLLYFWSLIAPLVCSGRDFS